MILPHDIKEMEKNSPFVIHSRCNMEFGKLYRNSFDSIQSNAHCACISHSETIFPNIIE